MKQYKTEATLTIFPLLELICNRRKLDVKAKLSRIRAANAFASGCTEEDYAVAFLKLHYRLLELLKFNGTLSEIDSAIGKEGDNFAAFIERIRPVYEAVLRYPDGEGADSISDSDKTPTGETTVDSVTAKTESNDGLASFF